MAEQRREDLTAQTTATTPVANRDPISGEPGSHPVGAGLGAAAGGAAAGAAGEAMAGSVGMPVGAAVGVVAGKCIAASIDPTTEDAYWRENYAHRHYHDPNVTYNEIAPAYRYGWESRARHAGRRWNDVENDLERGWNAAKAHSRLAWDRARHAARDAWDRLENAT